MMSKNKASEEIDVDTLLDATLKDPNALNSQTVSNSINEVDSSKEQNGNYNEESKRERKRSRERDEKDLDRKHRRRSRSQDRERDRDRDYRDKDRDRRSRSPSRRSSRYSERDRERDREREIERERRRRDIEREEERRKEMMLDPLERQAIEIERDARTVFAFNLPLRAHEDHLNSFFGKAGKVRDIRLITDRNSRKSKGVGYIEFADKTSIPAAISLSGTQLLGHTIQVQPTHAEKNRVAATNTTITTTFNSAPNRLYVGSLHFNTTEEDIKKVFNKYGEVDFVNLHMDQETGRSKGFGFVQFKRSDDARRALQSTNGIEIAGRQIKVNLVNENGTKSDIGISSNGSSATSNSASSLAPLQIGELGEIDNFKLNAQSRAELMQKLQRSTEQSSAPTSTSTSSSTSSSSSSSSSSSISSSSSVPLSSTTIENTSSSTIDNFTSTCVLLKNMFDPESETEENWDLEIGEDVKSECSKFGSVVHIYVNKESQGFIYLKFSSVSGAQSAVNSLNGRWFAGRTIEASFIPEHIYHVRFPESLNR